MQGRFLAVAGMEMPVPQMPRLNHVDDFRKTIPVIPRSFEFADRPVARVGVRTMANPWNVDTCRAVMSQEHVARAAGDCCSNVDVADRLLNPPGLPDRSRLTIEAGSTAKRPESNVVPFPAGATRDMPYVLSDRTQPSHRIYRQGKQLVEILMVSVDPRDWDACSGSMRLDLVEVCSAFESGPHSEIAKLDDQLRADESRRVERVAGGPPVPVPVAGNNDPVWGVHRPVDTHDSHSAGHAQGRIRMGHLQVSAGLLLVKESRCVRIGHTL